jgi:hypothetical protein
MTNVTTNLSLINAGNVKVTSQPAAKNDMTKIRIKTQLSQIYLII